MIAVVVSNSPDVGEEIAVGAALSGGGDLGETAVRAVLDSLNRRLPTFSG